VKKLAHSSLQAFVALAFALTPVSAPRCRRLLGNFDVINEQQHRTWFEIELEGLHSSDITDTFGGPARLSNRSGFDPAISVQRYGSPTITSTQRAVSGTRVTYMGCSTHSWITARPANFVTPETTAGQWRGCYNALTRATTRRWHLGNPAKTTYSWLLETRPGVLTNGIVNLPAPAWNVIPSPCPMLRQL